MPDEPVLHETDGPMAWVTPSRPDKLNAIGEEMRVRAVEVFEEAEADLGRVAEIGFPGFGDSTLDASSMGRGTTKYARDEAGNPIRINVLETRVGVLRGAGVARRPLRRMTRSGRIAIGTRGKADSGAGLLPRPHARRGSGPPR